MKKGIQKLLLNFEQFETVGQPTIKVADILIGGRKQPDNIEKSKYKKDGEIRLFNIDFCPFTVKIFIYWIHIHAS